MKTYYKIFFNLKNMLSVKRLTADKTNKIDQIFKNHAACFFIISYITPLNISHLNQYTNVPFQSNLLYK